jgi:hypothetical protein
MSLVEDVNLKTLALLVILVFLIFCVYKFFHGHRSRGHQVPSLSEVRAYRQLKRSPLVKPNSSRRSIVLCVRERELGHISIDTHALSLTHSSTEIQDDGKLTNRIG